MNSLVCWKTQRQMFLSVSGGYGALQSLINLGTTLFRISRIMKYRTDLSLGEAFCIFIFFHFPDSGLSVLNGMHFYF